MGYVIAHSACLLCREPFGYNPLRLPSITVSWEDGAPRFDPMGTREPICPTCVVRINPLRQANGLAPILPMEDAYEPCDEAEL